MRCGLPAFSGNRLNLEKHVLKSLAEKEHFDGFITYIRHPRKQTEIFIKQEVQKYIFTENKTKALNILKKNIDDIEKLVSRALFTATDKVKTQSGDIEKWVEEFSSLLKDELTFDTICCQNFCDINKFDLLKEETEKGLKSVIEEMSSLSLDKMKEFRLQPDQILIDQLCQCCWKELEDYYKLKFQGRGEIPSEWKTHSKEDAIKSLDEMFNKERGLVFDVCIVASRLDNLTAPKPATLACAQPPTPLTPPLATPPSGFTREILWRLGCSPMRSTLQERSSCLRIGASSSGVHGVSSDRTCGSLGYGGMG
ncbi:hypothetical protein L3Q82_002839 [Scortum barcoo]|uniref:Uncharacterized protein n=1 Tax=Scortum barcoo TaxID=214431 RepID=A0ACB8VUS2_9TELE|nr:hypothetical protein L3Q82_002839 [Scortum barcoo]